MRIQNIQTNERIPDIVYITIIGIVTLAFFIDSLNLELESVLAPMILMVLITIFMLLALLEVFSIPATLGFKDHTTDADDDNLSDLAEEKVPEIQLRGAIVAVAFIAVSIVVTPYIGYFSTSVVYSSAFIFIHKRYIYEEERSLLWDVVYSLVIGFLVGLFLWFLFIEFFESTSLLGFGHFV